MKLYSSPATPFGRKAAIVANEHDIALDIENVNPFTSEELVRLNPAKPHPRAGAGRREPCSTTATSSAPISTGSAAAPRSTPRPTAGSGSAA